MGSSEEGKTKKSKRRRKRSRERKNNEFKRSKRRRSPLGTPPRPQELLFAAALGDHHRCQELLRQGADVHWSDGDMTTPLHASSRAGHLRVVQLLLRFGANASAQDLIKGDTPAHLAARNGHLQVLHTLLESKTIGSALHESNDKGETVEQLSAAAMASEDHRASLAAERRSRAPLLSSSYSFSDGDEEEVWREKLQREMSPEEGEYQGAFYGEDWHADEYETAEEYAHRIWKEIQEKKARKQAEQRFKEALHGAEKAKEGKLRKEEARKKAAEKESARILEEERGGDMAWRAAVAAGGAAVKLASYEARWEFFCTKNGTKLVYFADVPWILPLEKQTGSKLGVKELKKVLLYGTDSRDQQRRMLRRELVRWHTDKFLGKFGSLFAAEDRERIVKGVTETSQLLTQLLSDVQAGG